MRCPAHPPGTDLRAATRGSSTIWSHAGDGRHPFRVVGDLSVLGAEVELPRNEGRPSIAVEARLATVRRPRRLRLRGPLDGTCQDGTPWIPKDIKERVRIEARSGQATGTGTAARRRVATASRPDAAEASSTVRSLAPEAGSVSDRSLRTIDGAAQVGPPRFAFPSRDAT